MKKIEEKTLRILEYPKILEQLSKYALSESAKNEILNLKPSTEVDEVSYQQQATADALKILVSEGGMPLVTIPAVEPIFKRMRIQATLDGQELAVVGRLLSVSREVVEFFDKLAEKEFEVKVIDQFIDQIVPMKTVERQILNSVSESGYVYDQASVKLASIRTKIARTETTIRSHLERITQGKDAKYLSDSLITMRNDRYVIPVQANYRSKFGGVVHDQSASGQTLFIEPQRVLDLNNQLKELQSEEKHEVERILEELTYYLIPYLSELETNNQLLLKLDVLQAKATYARDIKAVKPEINTDKKIALYEARHPLIPADEVVANDIILGKDYQQIIVTGPNTGGKTVVLKTLGLLQLMAQTGLHIPAMEGSAIRVYEHILADIGDEQSIEQSLSTFSSHMTSIVSIMEIANENSLVLFDELGAGTDPQEGAALAMAILDNLMARRSDVVTTSHYPELKAFGYNRPYTMNASMEFDIDSLQPTYRFLMGIPGKSNALEIAKRLGLDDSVIETAKKGISHESQGIDDMIVDLNKRQKELMISQKEMKKNLIEAETLHRKLKQAHEEYLEDKKEREKRAREQANQIIEKAEKKAERIISEIRELQMSAERDAVKEHELIDLKSQLRNLKHEEDHLKQNKVLRKAKAAKEIKEGQTVRVLSLNQQGTVVEKFDDKHWMVQLGMIKIKVPEKDLEVLVDPAEQEPKTKGTTVKANTAHVRSELDLRGERVENALYELDQYIDQAILANLSQVTIIHGVGTGAVRTAVRNRLRNHSRVASYAYAPANQGGNGATIVKLK